jgi:hypothetical protein
MDLLMAATGLPSGCESHVSEPADIAAQYRFLLTLELI